LPILTGCDGRGRPSRKKDDAWQHVKVSPEPSLSSIFRRFTVKALTQRAETDLQISLWHEAATSHWARADLSRRQRGRAMRPIYLALCAAIAVTPVAAQQKAATADGAQVFTMVCAMCHSVQPPAKAAPPMSHVTAYYLRKHVDTTAAAAAIVDYLKKPEAARSLMPPMAIERFGLMPAQSHLSDAQLDAVARYVLTLADTAHGHGRMRH